MLTFSKFPLLWVSKIQTEIDISTLYSNDVELSHFIRELTPLKTIIKEVIKNLGIDSDKLKFVSSSTVYEENNGAIIVETSPRITTTSKHIAVKYHWFRQKFEK